VRVRRLGLRRRIGYVGVGRRGGRLDLGHRSLT
jgi:hypothetical protein